MPNDLDGLIESIKQRHMSGELEKQASMKRKRVKTNRFIDSSAKTYTQQMRNSTNQKKKKKKTKKTKATPDPLSDDSDDDSIAMLKSKHIRSSKKWATKK